jgi:organic radical activating enzyme
MHNSPDTQRYNNFKAIVKKILKGVTPYGILWIYRTYLRKIPVNNKFNPRTLLPLHIHLTDHCNLNCRGCDNFAPLATEKNINIATFERDCARISLLTNGQLEELQLLGGEPLLHPQIHSFPEIARKYFKECPIKIITNGILLSKQSDEFWKNCKQNNVQIVVTKYPIKIDHNAIKQLAENYGVTFGYYGNTDTKLKTMFCDPLDLEGTQDEAKSFMCCHRSNACIELNDGKLYTCETIPNVKYFNDYFNQNLPVTDKDYIDIYKVNTIQPIFDFLCKPVPFCRYCDIANKRNGIKWSISRKEISEWI